MYRVRIDPKSVRIWAFSSAHWAGAYSTLKKVTKGATMMSMTAYRWWIILLWSLQAPCSSASKDHRPNILLLLTDDQDVVLGSFNHMPKTRALLQEHGITFENAFVHTPICCPSRSSILTGHYLHNGGAFNNSLSGNCYGQEWQEATEKHHTYAVHAKRAGYTTAYAGKYLNRYGEDSAKAVPPGWDHWLGLVGNSKYYNYNLVEATGGKNKTVHRHGNQYPEDYLPNVLRKHTLEWLLTLPEPWLMVVAWPTPHGPFTPAPWAVDTMSTHHAPITPEYNASTVYMQQKHWMMRQLRPVSQETASSIDQYYQQRLEALKSVDLHVDELVQTLDVLGQLDDTVIMYTSDNGYQFGQHRLAMDKRHLYEHDIRVPFVIRGPNIARNMTVSDHMVANIDIAPTIVDIALPEPASEALKDTMDGTSFWNFVQGKNNDSFSKRKDMLISYHGEGQTPCGMADCPPLWDGIWWTPDGWNNTYHCVRTLHSDEDSIYCRFLDNEGFVEFYNLTENPHQLENNYPDLEVWQRQRYERRLQELLSCQGPTCRVQGRKQKTSQPK